MTSMKIAAVVAAAALATGCATQQQTGALTGAVIGGVIGGGVGAGAGAYIAGAAGAVAGGVIGSVIGKHMDDKDREVARLAAESGKTTTWINSRSNKTYTVESKDVGEKREVTTTVTDSKGVTEKETTVVKKPIRQ